MQRADSAPPFAKGPLVRLTSQKTSPGRDSLVSEIRGAGLRATASRVAVLDMLHRSDRPISHAEVVEELKAFTWDRSTLYRNLIDLADVGLLSRKEVGDRTWRFEINCSHGHADHNAHFLCSACGNIVCLPNLVVMTQTPELLPKALHDGHVEIQIVGYCDTCIPGH